MFILETVPTKKEYDVFERIEKDNIGEMVGNTIPTITFDGGSVYDGWLHIIFAVTKEGLTLEQWESGGRQESLDIEEHPVEVHILLKEAFEHDPLPKWSNQKGLEFLNNIMNKVSEEDYKKKIRKIRDSLNKCRDIVKLEACAVILEI